MKRAFDIFFALIAVAPSCVLALLIALAIRLTSEGPVIYWSKRVGKNNVLFDMPKFRTMRVDTPAMATHLMTNASAYLTPIGGFLRRSSLDELPQFWCILTGKMSLVGPRPALFNQYDLIEMRTRAGVDILTPGLTGWAQVNGRDELPLELKVQYDKEYLARKTLIFDLFILWRTARKVLNRENVSH